jgi:NAD+ synthase
VSVARLTPAVFDLDVQATAETIERFIADQLTDLGRTGIVVPLSGGLDSSTVLALCVRAVGADRVTALLLPDKRGSKDALRFSRLVAERLGVRVVVQTATRLNRAGGVYRFIGYRLPMPRIVAREVRRHLSDKGDNVFLAGVRGTDHVLTRQALAAIYARQRLRMVMTYRYADLHRLLVVGTAHKSEDLLGLFVKFGVDDSADLMPLKGLYRSHVVQIAAAVGVPPEILARSPNPEMLPGIDDKYLDVFGVPAPTIDLAL